MHFGERMSFVSCSSFGIAFATSTLLTHTKGTSCGSIIRQQLASKYRIISRNLHSTCNQPCPHASHCVHIVYICIYNSYLQVSVPTNLGVSKGGVAPVSRSTDASDCRSDEQIETSLGFVICSQRTSA